MQGSSEGKSPKVGDIVRVYKEGTMRGSWKLAVVEGLIVGKDKEVRGAIVKVITKGKQVCISRPVQRLFPLELHPASQENTRANEGVVECTDTRHDRPRRAATLDATWKTKGMLLSSDNE